jgi:hypothetical protein
MAEKRKAVEVVVVDDDKVATGPKVPKVVKRMPDDFYTRIHPDAKRNIFWSKYRLAYLQCLPRSELADAGPWVYYNEELGLYVNADHEDRYKETDVKKAVLQGLNRTHFLLLPLLNEDAVMFFCAIASKASASIQWKIPETTEGCDGYKYQLMFEMACLRAALFQTLSTQGFTPRQIELTKEFDPKASAGARALARAPASAPASKK